MIALVLAAALAVAPSAGGERVWTVNGGPSVVLAPRPSTRATLLIQFPVGSLDDDQRSGLTRLTQHALLEDNRSYSYSQLLNDLYAADAELSVSTGVRESGFKLTASREDFPALAAHLLALVLSPALDPRAFSNAVARTLKDEEDTSGDTLLSLMASHAFPDARYRNEPYGDADTIEQLSFDEVTQFAARHFSPVNARIVVAGGFNPAALAALVSRFRGGTRLSQAREKWPGGMDVEVRSAAELHLTAFPISGADPKRWAQAQVLAAVLQERIQRKMRAAGVVYSMDATVFHRPWLDCLMLVIPADRLSWGDASKVLDAELARLRKEPISSDELDRNRKYVLRTLAALDDDPPTLAEVLSAGPDRTGWYGPELERALAGLTAPELLKVAQAWLADSSAIQVSFTPRRH